MSIKFPSFTSPAVGLAQNRMSEQIKQIQEGLKNGTITQAEAQKLLGQQSKVADLLKQVQADGVVTGREARQLARALGNADKNIFTQATNSQRGMPDLGLNPVRNAQQEQLGQLADMAANGGNGVVDMGDLLRDQAGIAGATNAASQGGLNPLETLGLMGAQAGAQGKLDNAQAASDLAGLFGPGAGQGMQDPLKLLQGLGDLLKGLFGGQNPFGSPAGGAGGPGGPSGGAGGAGGPGAAGGSPFPTFPGLGQAGGSNPFQQFGEMLRNLSGQGLRDRQANQVDSINRGLQNGSLTQGEAQKLLGQQALIAGLTKLAAADGIVDGREQKMIGALQNLADRARTAAENNGARGTPNFYGLMDPSRTQQSGMLSAISQGLRDGSLGDLAGGLLAGQAQQAGRNANPLAQFSQVIQQLMQNAAGSMLGF